jgi:hypothetical protein
VELVLYSIISWLVATYLITTIQKKEVVRSIIIYFIFTLLTVSSFSIIGFNLQLVQVTKDRTKFLSLLMDRNIIMPFLILIFINSFYRITKYNKKIIAIIVLLLLDTLLEFIKLKLQIYSYVNWNLGLMFLFHLLFVLITLSIGKYINYIQIRCEYK